MYYKKFITSVEKSPYANRAFCTMTSFDYNSQNAFRFVSRTSDSSQKKNTE